jgi:hypothetical protein
MAFETIMDEVDQLNLAGDRIQGLAEHYQPVAEALVTIARCIPSAFRAKRCPPLPSFCRGTASACPCRCGLKHP